MNKQTNTEYQPIIHYDSESIDVTLTCANSLKAHDYKNKNVLASLDLLEEELCSYSIKKLLKWNKQLVTELEMDQLIELKKVNKHLSSCIPEEKDRISYFTQYAHCIIYILGVLSNEGKEINWCIDDIKEDSIIQINNGRITKIITNKNIPIEELPSRLINHIKDYYKKGPILKK